jgi:hypothetical protein
MTLSAADATKHAIENPYLHPFLGYAKVGVTPSRTVAWFAASGDGHARQPAMPRAPVQRWGTRTRCP